MADADDEELDLQADEWYYDESEQEKQVEQNFGFETSVQNTEEILLPKEKRQEQGCLAPATKKEQKQGRQKTVAFAEPEDAASKARVELEFTKARIELEQFTKYFPPGREGA